MQKQTQEMMLFKTALSTVSEVLSAKPEPSEGSNYEFSSLHDNYGDGDGDMEDNLLLSENTKLLN